VSFASRAVAFEGVVREVRPAPVGLDDQVVLRPEEVDLLACDGAVDERSRQVVGIAESEEHRLEFATGKLLVAVEAEDGHQPPCSGMGRMQAHGAPQRGEVEEPEDLRALDGAREARGRQGGALSSRVRATVVTGMLRWVVVSASVSVPLRWMRIRSRDARPFRVATVTSILGSEDARSSQCARPTSRPAARIRPPMPGEGRVVDA
jgi:hypothetical protein